MKKNIIYILIGLTVTIAIINCIKINLNSQNNLSFSLLKNIEILAQTEMSPPGYLYSNGTLYCCCPGNNSNNCGSSSCSTISSKICP
jgi:hypothetical protein